MKKVVALALTLGVGALAFGACGDDSSGPTPVEGVQVIFDLTVDLESQDHFFDAPYPLDTRLSADGHPQLAGFPNPTGSVIVGGLVSNAAESRGFPVIPVVFFRFDGAIAPQDGLTTLPVGPSSSIHLIDADESSPDYGKLIPVVAKTLEVDPRYTPENVLGVAPRPGFILRPNTRYGVAVMDGLADAGGELLAPSSLLERVKIGKTEGAAEATLAEVMAPLWPALEGAGVDPGRVVAATVFTTGDVVAELAAIGDQVLEDRDVTIEGLALDATEDYPELCVLRGTVTMPQFQKGTPPFDTEGRFEFADGKLVEQGTLDVPAVVVIPKRTMPTGGFPLILNVHGSGGFSIAMVRPVGDDGMPGDPIGPAFPHAVKNIATAGIAMPVNPERLPGASEIEYLNVDNFGAMRDTFRQGTIEARLFLEALTQLEIPPETLASCTGAALPAGETAFRFDPDELVVMGQSMGGMYTNFLAATDPTLKAAVPTGAGGHWTYFIMLTPLEGGAYPGQLQIVLQSGPLSFFHPLFAIGAAGLEAADPMVYMPRVARRPLDGHPVRPVYEPVAIGDSYFPTEIYDAAALAYGHRQAGEEVWSTMQDALALVGLEGVTPFPISQNVTSETGEDYTGVVAQFEGDGTYDPHAIYVQRDDVKRQYSCFLDSFFTSGVATVPPLSDDWAAPCP
jgi:hypothetical protein